MHKLFLVIGIWDFIGSEANCLASDEMSPGIRRGGEFWSLGIGILRVSVYVTKLKKGSVYPSIAGKAYGADGIRRQDRDQDMVAGFHDYA